MTFTEEILKEYDSEMATTRRLLERLPTSQLDWKPHGKSRTLGELGTHVTELPRWGLRLREAQFQVGSEKAPPLKTLGEFLARFDDNVTSGRQAIARGSSAGCCRDRLYTRPLTFRA